MVKNTDLQIHIFAWLTDNIFCLAEASSIDPSNLPTSKCPKAFNDEHSA